MYLYVYVYVYTEFYMFCCYRMLPTPHFICFETTNSLISLFLSHVDLQFISAFFFLSRLSFCSQVSFPVLQSFSLCLLLHLRTLTALATQNKAKHSKRHTSNRRGIKKGTKLSPWVRRAPQLIPKVVCNKIWSVPMPNYLIGV